MPIRFPLAFICLLACMSLALLGSPAWASDVPPPGDTTPLQSPTVPEPAPAAVADPVAPKRRDDEPESKDDPIGMIEVLRADLATALATIAIQAEALTALRAEYEITKGHVQRIGECPGLKLF